MPTEYFMLGHVSIKTDSFAYGIVLLQMMSNLSGRGARGILQLELDYVNAESLGQQQDIKERSWPTAQLGVLAGVVQRCTQEKPNRRCNVADIISEMEGLLTSER
jgi:hypothetical protein